MYVSILWGGICLGSKCLPFPSMGMTNTPSGQLWCLLGRFCCVGKTQSGMFLSMSSGGSMLRPDNFSLLQASIVTIADPSLPLLISSLFLSPQRLTAWWCRFMCILFRVWLLHLRSMCGALSGPPHKGQVAGPVVWLNRLVCLSVCIVPVLYLRTCSCSLKVTFGTDQNLLLNWAWARVFASACCVWESGCAARLGSCNFCQGL